MASGSDFGTTAPDLDAYLTLPNFTLQAIVFVATLQLCFYYCDLYTLTAIRGRHEQVIAVGQSVGAGCLLLGILYFVFPPLLLGRGVFFISVILVPPFVTFSRVAFDRIWQAAATRENLLIIGTESQACKVAIELEKRNDLNVMLVGFFDLKPGAQQNATLRGLPVMGSADGDLESIVEAKR